MTPPARLSAAIEVLDHILAGQTAGVALSTWGRASRYAGSKDRYAVRDLVYGALRCKRSFAALGGAQTGRGLILGQVRAAGEDPVALFDGQGHAPTALGPADAPRAPTELEALDCPDWLAAPLRAALGQAFEPVMRALQSRAPVYLRVNLAKSTPEVAMASLARDGIVARQESDFPSALEIVENSRKINVSEAYHEGLVELQDLSSQAVVEGLRLQTGLKVLDYCAGGGGKTLALAAHVKGRLYAHDHFPARMKDLPERAKRAGAEVKLVSDPAQFAPYDLVLCDAPCSGSGSWRRDPQGKWALTPERLAEICAIQHEILDRTAQLVQPEGVLCYATCSFLREENEDQIAAFLVRHPDWECRASQRLGLPDRSDGFFVAHLCRKGPRV
jgi:16S rRNA (cytosine967-C5)-methyltransferase